MLANTNQHQHFCSLVLLVRNQRCWPTIGEKVKKMDEDERLSVTSHKHKFVLPRLPEASKLNQERLDSLHFSLKAKNSSPWHLLMG